MNEKLTTVIDELVEQKTFSLEGVDAIKKLRDGVATLETNLADIERRLKTRDEELTTIRLQIAEKDATLTRWSARETELTKRESNITALEKQTAVSDAKAAVIDSVFTRIFVNRTIRESVLKSGSEPVANGGGGYPITMPTSSSETIERTES